MSQFKFDDCILILGRRRCGKTTLGKNLQKLWPRKIIIDTLWDYDEYPDQVYSFDEFTQRLLYIEENNIEKFELVYRFDPESRTSAEEFDHICRLAWKLGNVQVVCEEVHTHASTHYLSHWLENLIFKGRHRGVSVLATTQRPGMLNKNILSQCEHIFCGPLVEPNDIYYASKIFNNRPEDFLSLRDYRFLYRSSTGIIEVGNEI